MNDKLIEHTYAINKIVLVPKYCKIPILDREVKFILTDRRVIWGVRYNHLNDNEIAYNTIHDWYIIVDVDTLRVVYPTGGIYEGKEIIPIDIQEYADGHYSGDEIEWEII